MFMHNKKLQYTVRVSKPNPKLSTLMLEQFGGPQGELAAAMRYFTQGIAELDPGRKDMLMDIATEELSHLEVIGNIVCMLNTGAKGAISEGMQDAELLSEITKDSDSYIQAALYGGGAGLINGSGQNWTAAYVDTIGEPTADLRSNIAAESRAKIIYERIINLTDDPDVRDALTFLMTREVAHQKSFEKALYSIANNFPPGKLPPDPNFASKYFNHSQGDGDANLGPWNSGDQWEFIGDYEQLQAVDGGSGMPTVKLNKSEEKLLKAVALRGASDPDSNPLTGAELGMGLTAPADGNGGSKIRRGTKK
jgi:Mn-containing catalase